MTDKKKWHSSVRKVEIIVGVGKGVNLITGIFLFSHNVSRTFLSLDFEKSGCMGLKSMGAS